MMWYVYCKTIASGSDDCVQVVLVVKNPLANAG